LEGAVVSVSSVTADERHHKSDISIDVQIPDAAP
jgi:hypothetical protein